MRKSGLGNLYACSHAHPRLRVSISLDDVDFCEKIVSLDDDEMRNKFEWPRENLKKTGFVMHFEIELKLAEVNFFYFYENLIFILLKFSFLI